MLLCTILRHRTSWNAILLLFPLFIILLITPLMILSLRPEVLLLKSSSFSPQNGAHTTNPFQKQSLERKDLSPPPLQVKKNESPYHNWELFNADYQDMLQKLKIFIYGDIFNESSAFARVFLPHPNPFDPKIGNYYSEHAFKRALLESTFVTEQPSEANFFFMPFSINVMRNHPLLHSELNISRFVADYVLRISNEFHFWNASAGTDHFFVCCHSVGREVGSKHFEVRNNAIQISCSSSYFQRLYTAHKDVALPQVWPRESEQVLNPPNARTRLVFFAGRVQNSPVRKELLTLWKNDTSFHIFSNNPSFPYEEGFRSSKYCLHVKGYEVNTARVSDAIHYGCVPILISNYYDLPFANVLDWTKFSIIVNQRDVAFLKNILTSVSEEMYLKLYENLCVIRRHFRWHSVPRSYDAFHMTVYQLWLRRGLHRVVI